MDKRLIINQNPMRRSLLVSLNKPNSKACIMKGSTEHCGVAATVLVVFMCFVFVSSLRCQCVDIIRQV
jgi:hypothetical protein